MPKYSWVKKGKAKRPTGRTRRVRKRSSISKSVSNVNKTLTCKYRAWTPLISDETPGQITIPLNAVGYYAAGGYTTPTASAFGLLPEQASSTFQTLFSIFDTYRVNKLTVTLVTRYLDNGPQATETDMQCLYAMQDDDDMGLANQLTMDDRAAIPIPVNQGDPSKFHRFILNQTALGKKTFYNCQNVDIAPGIATNSSTGLMLLYYRSLKFYQPEPLGAPNYFGRLICDWDVTFKSLV